MSDSPLGTHAGPIAVSAGGLLVVAHVGMFLTGDRSDLVAMMKDPLFLPFNAAYFIAFPLLLIALVAIYRRQEREAGAFGAIAFCAAATGTVALAGDMWFEGFAVPWLAQTAPASISGPAPSGSLLWTAWLVSVVLFSLGWALFGLASARAGILPRALSLAVAVGGAVGFLAAMPPWGLALGLAIAAVGIWMIRQDRTLERLGARPARMPVAVATHR
jgi:hypothetical protein